MHREIQPEESETPELDDQNVKSSTSTSKPRGDYVPLPHEFGNNDGWYRLIRRKGILAIHDHFDPKNHEKQMGYVVAKIRTQGRKVLPSGKILPTREIFPPPSKFGTDGFFCMPKSAKSSGLEKSEKKFRGLVVEKGRCSFNPRPIRRANRKRRGKLQKGWPKPNRLQGD